jgi:hypothetical protein
MPSLRAPRAAVALLGYACVAIAFFWPLPAELTGTLPGSPSGDTGVYVWNLWVFRHELIAHGRSPLFTSEIIALAPPVPLALHNYTTFADLLALPLLPLFGTVATFNLLTIASSVLSALMMFVLLRRITADDGAAWVGGALFGFSPFMTARSMAHFSLVQAAALPAFGLVVERLRTAPSIRWAVLAGVVIAWAFVSDPYYAVYCLLIGAFAASSLVGSVERGPARLTRVPLRTALDVAILCLGALIAGITIGGGGRFELLGLRISMTRLYTPVLLLTLLIVARIWITLRPRIAWTPRLLRPHVWTAAVAALTCAMLLAPVLSAMTASIRERQWIAPDTRWRSSAAGVALLAFAVPNPTGSLLGWISRDWTAALPEGFVENVAAVPWTVIVTIVVALLYAGLRLPRYWVAFTAFFALLALGPFVHVGGWATYVPTPWALMRYLPVVGAARMPTRLTVLVMFGAAVLRPWLAAAVVGVFLLAELMPAPRTLYPAHAPQFLNTIAADPRDIRVLHLPFGLRDGLTSAGDHNALSQFYQGFHEKPLLGGYLSRLRRTDVELYRSIPFFESLIALSERRQVPPERLEHVIASAGEWRPRLGIGYVIVYGDRASPQLVSFAKSALDLEFVASEGDQALYRVR